jgi:hypothetical protein
MSQYCKFVTIVLWTNDVMKVFHSSRALALLRLCIFPKFCRFEIEARKTILATVPQDVPVVVVIVYKYFVILGHLVARDQHVLLKTSINHAQQERLTSLSELRDRGRDRLGSSSWLKRTQNALNLFLLSLRIQFAFRPNLASDWEGCRLPTDMRSSSKSSLWPPPVPSNFFGGSMDLYIWQ